MYPSKSTEIKKGKNTEMPVKVKKNLPQPFSNIRERVQGRKKKKSNNKNNEKTTPN